jgi:signal transduction histidine kinase/ActR/RegA family two-component response regulator
VNPIKPGSQARAVLLGMALAALHFGASLLGLRLAAGDPAVAAIWPASGVALWIALAFGSRYLLAVLASTLAVCAMTRESAPMAAALAANAVLEPWLAAVLMRRVAGFRVPPDRPRDAVGLIAFGGVAVPALCTALLWACTVWISPMREMSSFEFWVSWWASHAIGVLVFTLALLEWTRRPDPAQTHVRAFEFVLLVACAALASCGAFGLLSVPRDLAFAVRFSLLPLLVWTGLRFSGRETASVIVVFGAAGSIATLIGRERLAGLGFGSEPVLQAFLAFMAASGVLLATVTNGMRRTERELRAALSLLGATLDSTADGVLVVDTQGRMRHFNRTFRELWRIPRRLMESGDDQAALAFVLDQLRDPSGFLSRVQELYAHPEATSADVLEFKDGRIFERMSVPQREGTRVVGRVWCFRDVTEARRLERELRQTQKMEAVGRLAGGVAHEFNNLLTVILGRCEILLQSADAARRQDALAIRGSAERAAELTRQLLAFSRRQVLSSRLLNLNTIVEDTSAILARLLPAGITLRTDLARTLGGVSADPVQLQQMLLNLTLHARDAMPEGGTMLLRTYEVMLENGGREEGLDLPAGEYVVVSVADTGAGLDEEARGHVFEPFFGTKPIGNGGGLGLPMAYGIVRQSGGDVSVWSAPGEGTHFRVFLPRVDDEAGGLIGTGAESNRPGLSVGRAILLVEAADETRRALSDALRVAGHRVIPAADANEALEQARTSGEAIDALVTNVTMAEVSGFELAERLRVEHGVRVVLFTAGYGEGRALEPMPSSTTWEVLQKPFAPQRLARAVTDLCERVASLARADAAASERSAPEL